MSYMLVPPASIPEEEKQKAKELLDKQIAEKEKQKRKQAEEEAKELRQTQKTIASGASVSHKIFPDDAIKLLGKDVTAKLQKGHEAWIAAPRVMSKINPNKKLTRQQENERKQQ